MYHMKPIISSDIHIEYSNSMYKVKPISTDHSTESQKINLNVSGNELADQSKDSSMEELEARQEVILRHLKELKERLMSMHKDLKICGKPVQPRVTQPVAAAIAQKPIESSNLRDIVINANPNNVPFSLVVLKKLWTNRISLTLQFYTHSTVSNLPQAAINFQNTCTAQQPTSSINLNISLIWKNIDNIEMINGSSWPVIGESNILRYLARIGPNEFNYELNGSNCNEVDSQLDISELLVAAPTAKDRQVILKNLNTKLGKNEFFGGTQPSLSDLSLASAVFQSTADKELPPALLKWSRKVIGDVN